MDRRDWLFGLKEIPGIGLVTVQNFLKHMKRHINKGPFPMYPSCRSRTYAPAGSRRSKARAIKQT